MPDITLMELCGIGVVSRRTDYLFCLRALEVGTDRERARIILLHVGHPLCEVTGRQEAKGCSEMRVGYSANV
jgi:hypothetical protein